MAMPSALLLFAVTLILNVELLTAVVYPDPEPEPEVDALSALKKSLSDPEGVLKSWDPSFPDPCNWFHVHCNDQRYVIRVDLGSNNFSGQLVPELGNLTQLQYLGFYRNNIEGSIPLELGNLTNLKELDLSDNNLSGPLPSSFENLKSLNILKLGNNKFLSGTVPQALLGIRVLEISNTSITEPPTGI